MGFCFLNHNGFRYLGCFQISFPAQTIMVLMKRVGGFITVYINDTFSHWCLEARCDRREMRVDDLKENPASI